MKLYYGWIIVAISALVYLLVVGVTFNAFSVFVIPASAEFNLSRADANMAIAFLSVGSAFLAPVVGRMLDRFPAKWIMIGSALCLAFSFVTLGVSRSIWLSAAVMAVPLAAAYLGAGSLTMTVLIARWFVSQRGRAMTLATMGMSLGNIIVTPIIGFLVEHEGWRTTLFLIAGSVTALLLIVTLMVRERPGAQDIESGSPLEIRPPKANDTAPAAMPIKVGAALRMPQFWTLGLGAALPMGILQAGAISLVPFALEGGYSMLQATSLMSAMGTGAIVGTLLFAVIADKLDKLFMFAALCCLLALLNAALLVGDRYTLLLACAALLGMVAAPVAPIFYALLADRFGAPSFGTVRGLMMPVISSAGIVAVRFAGEVFDRTGGYDVMFGVFAIVLLLAAGLLLGTRLTETVGEQVREQAFP